ncbi:MAG TPA: ABC transporter permease [Gemmatimonadaceae bacterium]|nr:ABC transporter permease [Gemmatimonadaceae bacterium]
MTRPPGVRRLLRLPRRSGREIATDVEDELQFHLEQAAAALRARGWSEAEAREEARRQFGDLEFTRHYCRAEDVRRVRETRRMTILDDLAQDVRYAWRGLRSSPGFAVTALLTLALGIGANTAIFSVVRGVLLEPLPFVEPDRLVRVWHANPADGITQGAVSEPDFLDWRAQARSAESMGAYFFADGLSGLDLTGEGEPERLSAALATDGFFETLGTPALRGRTFRPEEQVAGNDRFVVLSHGFWTRRFGADPAILGRPLTLNGEPFEVVGIMPPGFTYPAERTLDLWVPLSVFGPDAIGRSRGSHFLGVIARLSPGASESRLAQELSAVADRLSREFPENPGWDAVTTLPVRESILGEVRRPLVVLMVAVALLLLIACVNIASLLLARATGKQRELAVRAALGAGRWRIARQLLTESVMLGVLGGVLGAGLAVVGVRALASAGAGELPRAAEIGIDGPVLAFTFGVSVLCGLLFGLAPTLRGSANLEAVLRAGARGSVGRPGQRLRGALVVAEVALAVVLVIGAGLATKSFARLMSVDPGFQPENALVATASVPGRYDGGEARRAYYYRVLDAVRAIPGVRAAGAIRDLPLRANGEMITLDLPGLAAPGEGPNVQLHQISTDYFKAIGTPLRSGRAFALTDAADAPPVAIVNEELVRRLWPGEEAVGKTLRLGQAEAQVIGVVGNVRQRGLAAPVEPTMYLHALQNFRSRMSIVVRVDGDPARYASAVRQAIWSQDPEQTITGVATLESVVGTAVARPRLLAWLLALFGLIALTLGALGIFGVLAYAVSQRRQEIGVRVALGARPRTVLRLIVGQGMLLAAVGVVIGIGGALLVTRWMQEVLYEIHPTDVATFIQVVVVLATAAMLASWLPARRALRIDPVSTLRYD